MYIFHLLFKLSSSLLYLDENILLLKLRSLIDMSTSVPAHECINSYVEQVFILENPEKK